MASPDQAALPEVPAEEEVTRPGETREEANARRLAEWRRQREKVAEASRQERLRLAEAERQERLRQYEKEKDQRLRARAEARAQDEAASRTARLASARAKIAGRSDIDAARARIVAYRRSRMRRLGLGLLLAVALPVAAMGWYLTAVATPLYQAEARFVVEDLAASRPEPALPLAPSRTGGLAFVARDILLSADMLAALDARNDFSRRFGDAGIDPYTRFRTVPEIGFTPLAQYRRHVAVAVNRTEGSVTLTMRAPEPALAQEFVETALEVLDARLAALDPGGAEYPLRVYLGPVRTDVPAWPRPVPAMLATAITSLGLFAVAAIFRASLARHAMH